MLKSSHSLPDLYAACRRCGMPGAGDTLTEKRISSDSGIFVYDLSSEILVKLSNLAESLMQERPCMLTGSSLELLSIALVKGDFLPADITLAWKYSANTMPYTAFVPSGEKCWVSFEVLSDEQKARSVEIYPDGKNGYLAKRCGEVWKASGEEAFFKIMLAVKFDVSVDTISDRQASEFRRVLSESILEQGAMLGELWQDGMQSHLKLDSGCAGIVPSSITNNVISTPISVVCNPDWIDVETRPSCKYSPVIVSKSPHEDAIKSMQSVLQTRIDTCRKLAEDRDVPGGGSWFSFIRGPQLHEPHLHSGTVPTLVISGGNASKLSAELGKDYSLAWHPKNMRREVGARAEPVYLLVHKLDCPTYVTVLKETLEQHPNLHLVGWDGGKLTGFGAARASALAFADTLPFRPKRIMMVDQDVVKTEQTRHTNPVIRSNVESLHQITRQPIVGYGVGYPARQLPPLPFSQTLPPEKSDLNSPAQQFVSIQAPFRNQWDDGIYPPYMVAGGEDMLMGLELGLTKDDRNIVLPEERIVKKELVGPADIPNTYWNEGRVQTLKALFEEEKNTLLEFEGQKTSLDGLMSIFESRGWVASHPSAESYTVAACVVERIILRLNKELSKEVSNRSLLFRSLSA
ncbi:hypothetical protein [Pseudomonas sp. MAG733B]|uniref:hypothetical protein n=1 Tax=Pseudomonas sp. MAG733B TaxID=3122079 RepID=UPI0030CEB0A0